MSSRRRWFPVAAAALLLAVWPALAALDAVAERFAAGRYQEARDLLLEGGAAGRPAEEALWRSRLSDNPDEALTLLAGLTRDRRLPEAVRQRAALEIAELEAARGRHREALAPLEEVLGSAEGRLTGEIYLRAGLSLRALGRLQEAREMLASVPPEDPAFQLARTTLGEIGLQQGDPVLARRYFESAGAGGPVPDRAAAGYWRALRAEGDLAAAERVAERLQREHPGSLALLEIGRQQRREQEELDARVAGTAPARADTATAAQGRFCLQLAAFSDRSLALDFLRRYASRLPDLHIDPRRDERGQLLYKVRAGSFVNPVLARDEAQRLQRELDIDVIVADLAD